ncbi:MAG: 1-acyl-sn-glycerol-3-phosphate acyltransferase [Cyclobacteriaceae bacterium]
MSDNFDDIRSYNDHEVAPVIKKLIQEAEFIKAVKHVFPELNQQQIAEIFSGINSIKEFQAKVIHSTLQRIIKQTTNGLEDEGVANLDKSKSYLFITNHRDIVLDSALLNFILFNHGHNTTEIAIGDNLLIFPWITDVVKLNKSFAVKRSVPKDKIVEESIRLSTYIRKRIVEKNTSVWIAQREGRTKNGDDRTNPALLKMMNLSGQNGLIENFSELRIVPVSISYEYEPCDGYKVKEILTPDYKKTIKDDLESMFTGIFRPKGRVKYSFSQPLSYELEALNQAKKPNEQLKILAQLIDKNIHQQFQLWPTNYLAYDLLHDTSKFSEHYNNQEKEQFIEYMNYKFNLLAIKGDKEKKENAFLEIYANPVKNKYDL